MNPEKVIKRAIKLLQPIKYEPFAVGYFVMKDDSDMGGQDYCINCIEEQVKLEKKRYEEEKERIKAKYNLIETEGYCIHHGKKVKIKGKYTEEEIAISKISELKHYPEKATFTYEGHDPDFGGGLTEPCTCESCGKAFTCNFTPDSDEAQRLLDNVSMKRLKITDRDKWEIDIALSNYQYVKDDVKEILYKVAECIIIRLSKK